MPKPGDTMRIEVDLGETHLTVYLRCEDDGYDHEFGYREQLTWEPYEIWEEGLLIDPDDLSDDEMVRIREKAFEEQDLDSDY